MALRIQDIATALEAEAFGAVDLLVHRLAEPSSAGASDLALAMSPRYAEALADTQARAAVVWAGADWQALGLEAAIVVPRPRLALSGLTQAFDVARTATGIHPSAVIDPSATIGEGVSVGAFCVIGAGVSLGDHVIIEGHVSLADGVSIGPCSQLMAGVRMGRNVVLGSNCIVHSNAVIGADGFSFVTSEPSNEERAFKGMGRVPLMPMIDPSRHRIHSLGSVIVGDDVEVGANSSIDAGTIRATRVGRGTKIDNLVQVGHNVVIGEDCVLCAQTAVAGSAQIGDRVVLGGKSGVKDNITIGSDVVLGGAAIALSPVPNGRFMMGYPAVEMPEFRARLKAMRRSQLKTSGTS